MYKKSIARIAVLALIAAAGLILIFFREMAIENFTIYCIAVLVAKAVGIILIGLSWALYQRWNETDPLLSKYEKWCREADEARL